MKLSFAVRLSFPFLFFVLFTAAPAGAQSASPGNSGTSPGAASAAVNARNDEGDRAWAAVTALRQTPVAATASAPIAVAPTPTPTPTTPAGSAAPAAPTTPTAPTPAHVPFTPSAAALAQARTRAEAKVQSSRQTAAAAKDFHTRFPAHAQAPAARKLEALSGLAGITNTDTAHETAALNTAGDFRANKAHPISDRYEVAHAVERHVVGRKLGGKSWLSSPFESEAMADRLRGEFGHLPQVYGNYLAVAQHTQCDHSREVAQRILRMPVSPGTKVAAQRVVDRANLMRKPLDFPLTPVAGPMTRLATLAGSGGGKCTLVVFWDGVRMPAGPPGLHPYVQQAPANTTWVYVSLGSWTSPSGAAKGNSNANASAAANGKSALPTIKASAAPPGTFCVEPLGWRSPVAQQLKISSLPFVCVLDDKKNLNAFGRVDEIPALLAGINRLIEQ
jgi:hypothetical protein